MRTSIVSKGWARLLLAGLISCTGLLSAGVHGEDAALPSHEVRVVIKSNKEARLASQMDGQIVSIPFRQGQRFRQGQTLVEFSCKHQQASLAAAEAKLRKSEKNLAVQQSLAELNAVSGLELDLAEAEVAQVKAERSLAAVSVADCKIAAPFNGAVVAVMVNQWENVSRGAALIEVVNTEDLRVDAVVPSAWLGWLREGFAFSIDIDETRARIEAVVQRVNPKVDPVSRTVTVSARISPESSLLPGMSGTAHFRQVP